MQTKVNKIIPSSENPSVASGVEVNGEVLPADFIIMGVGVAPATEFLKDSGIELEKDGGVKVDEYLRVASGPPGLKGVFAIGNQTSYCRSAMCAVLTIWTGFR